MMKLSKITKHNLSKSFNKHKTAVKWGTFLLVALVVVAGGIAYYSIIYSDPSKTFWEMIDNNLVTSGVTKQTEQNDSFSSTTTTTQLVFSPLLYAHYQKQITDNSSKPPSKLTLNGLGTLNSDYNNYSKIDRPSKPADYSKLYKVWVKNDQPQLLRDSIFGGVLFGNLTAMQRQTLQGTLKETYKINSSSVKSSNGRKVIDYKVSLNMQKYTQTVVAYSKILGLSGADQISANAYPADYNVPIELTVDVLSRQLRKIEYSNAKISENYSGYGIAAKAGIPTKTVSIDEFQKTLNSIAN